jgi:TP901 family phage tail tape measure protein
VTDFSQFEKEAAQLLAQLRRSADNLAALERDARAGRTTGAETRARASDPYASRGRGGTSAEAEIRSRGLATDQLIARQRALTAAETQSANAERTMAQVMSQNSAQMRTSGALTNEFVDAAKRGEVTVRDLGNEVTGTIAKFGGWIVAGSAVYFAFDALTAVKKGAIDASSGVNELERVVNNVSGGRAQEGFRSLAQEFNVPIATASDAVYEMGKVFNNQADAFSSARQVLYAVKIGELDTAAASRYLISIINGFHLPASRMAGVLDQVNEAQNNFGIGTEDVLSGVAKAAGTFHQASGPLKKYGEDYSYLLALVTTGVKVTGQTGATVGTAIARSPNFIRRPSNQEALRQFGIDPNAGIEEVYDEAFKKAKGLSGKQVQLLAAAIGGPQYGARVFTGLLSNYDEFQKALKQTSPANAQGSAQRELSKQLSGVDEQITRIGVSLERLGAELAKSHFFDSLGLGLTTLNSMLDLVNNLAEDFGKLPEGAQQFLSYLIQVSLALKLLRRFNLGESIAGGQGAGGVRGAAGRFFGNESPEAFARQARKAFFAEQDALERERARLGGQLYRGQRKETLAFGAAGAAQEEVKRAAATHGPLSTQVAAAQTKAAAASAEATAAQQRNLALTLDEKAATERLAAVQTSIAATRRRIIGGLNVQATLAEAERLRYPIPPGFSGKGTQRPVILGGSPLPSQLKELETMKALEARGLVPQGLASQTEATTAGVTRTTTSIGGLGQKLGGLKGGLGRMSGAFSTLLGRAGELAFAAIAIGFLSDALVTQAEATSDDIERIAQQSSSSKNRLERLKSLRAGSSDGDNFGQRLSDAVNERVSLGPVDVPTLGLGKAFFLDTGPGTNEVEEEIEKAEIRTIEKEIALQKRARKEGKAVPLRFVGEITKDIERLKDSNKSRKEIQAGLDKYEEELSHSHASPRQGEELKKARQLIKEGEVESASNQTLVDKLQVLQASEIEKRLQGVLGLVGGESGVPFNAQYAQKAALIYQAEVQKVGKANDPESLQTLAQARQDYFSAIEGAIQGELQYSLDITRSPRGKNRAYATAFSRLRQFAHSGDSELRKQQEVVDKLRERRARAAEPYKERGPKGEYYTVPGGDVKAVANLDKQIGLETQKLKQLKDGETQKARFIRQIVAKLREQQYEANSALRSAQESAREALSANPILQTQQKLEFLSDEIKRAIAVYGRNSTQVLQLITEQRQAQQQLVQNQLGLIQARGNLNTAGILQDVPKQKAALYGAGGLLEQLSFVEAHAQQFDPKTLIELRAQVEAAKATLAQAIEQEANELAEGRFGVREARASYKGNTAQAAKLAAEKAKYELDHAKTPVEKLQAQQNYIQSLASKRDAVAQARLETINFEASIQKTTTQQEIEQLENLLSTYKLSLAAKRQVREQIHSLKGQLANESSAFNLNVGDFTLPTAYDIRRAVIGAGASGGPRTVNQTNNFQIANHSSDPNVVGRAIGQALGGAADSAARSAGVG